MDAITSNTNSAGDLERFGSPAASSTERTRLWLALAILLGIALRFSGLESKPLWEDEAWTFHTATAPNGVLAISGLDPHPLSYYFLYRALPEWFFHADWAFRLPSAVFSTASLLLFAAMLRLAGMESRLRVLSVALFAVLPINVRYAFEARAYALAECLAVAVLAAYFLARNRRSLMSFFILAISVALSAHIDGFGLAAPFAVLLHTVIEMKRDANSRRSAIAVLIGGALAIPYYMFRVSYFADHEGVHAIGESGSLINGFFSRVVELSPLGIGFDQVAASHRYAIYLAAAAGLIVLLASARTPRAWWGEGSRRLFTLFAIATPLIYAVLSVVLHANLMHKKYLLVVVPALTPLFAAGVVQLMRRARRLAFLGLLGVPLAVSVHLLVSPGGRADWRSLYEQIKGELRAGDVFIQQRQENYPEYGFGPLRAYAWRAGYSGDPASWIEYPAPALQEHASGGRSGPGSASLSLRHAGLESTIGGISPRVRIWTLTTDWMAKDRMLDLSESRRAAKSYSADGVRATLWTFDGRL